MFDAENLQPVNTDNNLSEGERSLGAALLDLAKRSPKKEMKKLPLMQKARPQVLNLHQTRNLSTIPPRRVISPKEEQALAGLADFLQQPAEIYSEKTFCPQRNSPPWSDEGSPPIERKKHTTTVDSKKSIKVITEKDNKDTYVPKNLLEQLLVNECRRQEAEKLHPCPTAFRQLYTRVFHLNCRDSEHLLSELTRLGYEAPTPDILVDDAYGWQEHKYKKALDDWKAKGVDEKAVDRIAEELLNKSIDATEFRRRLNVIFQKALKSRSLKRSSKMQKLDGRKTSDTKEYHKNLTSALEALISIRQLQSRVVSSTKKKLSSLDILKLLHYDFQRHVYSKFAKAKFTDLERDIAAQGVKCTGFVEWNKGQELYPTKDVLSTKNHHQSIKGKCSSCQTRCRKCRLCGEVLVDDGHFPWHLRDCRKAGRDAVGTFLRKRENISSKRLLREKISRPVTVASPSNLFLNACVDDRSKPKVTASNTTPEQSCDIISGRRKRKAAVASRNFFRNLIQEGRKLSASAPVEEVADSESDMSKKRKMISENVSHNITSACQNVDAKLSPHIQVDMDRMVFKEVSKKGIEAFDLTYKLKYFNELLRRYTDRDVSDEKNADFIGTP